MKRIVSVAVVMMASLIGGMVFAQDAETRWVDSVYNSLTLEQRVGQLFCLRANQPDKPYYDEVG